MKLLRLYRTIKLGKESLLYKDFYEFSEKPTYYLILRIDQSTNKQLPKNEIMSVLKPSIDFLGTELSCSIWCFDYQEKEAEEILEERIHTMISQRELRIKKELVNLYSLKHYIKDSEVKISKLNF
jgi:hypothetical protein